MWLLLAALYYMTEELINQGHKDYCKQIITN